ncbi:hypothetical protein KW531_21125 [Vibrio fluvialis]|nr:hypothetical protein [Vibrio fluvialis]
MTNILYRVTNSLRRIPFQIFVADAILYHHELADGQGYPKGLDSNAVSKHVKLVSLCNAFDAMTSQRPYRAPMSRESIRHSSSTFGDTI